MPGRGNPWQKGGHVDLTIEEADLSTALQAKVNAGGGGASKQSTFMEEPFNVGGVVTRFLGISCQDFSSNPSETNTASPLAGTIKSIGMLIASNSGAGVTFTFRKNDTDTALVLTIPATTTGTFLQLTDISIAVGDDLNIKFVGGGIQYMGTVVIEWD